MTEQIQRALRIILVQVDYWSEEARRLGRSEVATSLDHAGQDINEALRQLGAEGGIRQ